jgi:Tfp pilus assembly protein PilF/O-antigen ligase
MTPTVAWLGWVIEALIVGALLFAPVPLGSVFPWAAWALVGMAALLVALSALKMLAEGALVLRWTPLFGPGLAMAVVVVAQLVRPEGSVNPLATRESAALYLAYLGYFHVLGWHLVTRARIIRLVWVLVGWGTLLALLGLMRLAGGWGMWLGLPSEATQTRLVSTFFNANHQALYFAMVFFLAVGLLLVSAHRSQSARGPTTGQASGVLAGDRRRGSASRVVLVGAMTVIGTALLLTLSRGGVVSAWIAMIVTLAVVWSGRRWVQFLMLVAGVVGMLVLAIAGPGLDPLVARFSDLARQPTRDVRWELWGATVRMALNTPWLGSGLGTFQDRFALDGFPMPGAYVDHAHNDYLQLWLETGIVGVGVLAWGAAATGMFVLRRRAARRDGFARHLVVGGVGAVLVALLHSAVDFGIRLPGNAMLLVAAAALVPATVSLRRGPGGEWVDLPTWRWAPTGAIRLAVGLMVIAGAAAVSIEVTPRVLADWHLHQADRLIGAATRDRRAMTPAELIQTWSRLERAAQFDARQPVVQAAKGRVAVHLASSIWTYGVIAEGRYLATSSAPERFVASEPYFSAAVDAYQQSLRTRPHSGEVHERYGWLLAGLESVRLVARAQGLRATLPGLAPLINSDQSLLPKARAELEEAVLRDPLNPTRWFSLGLFALAHLGPGGGDVAARSFREALALDKRLIDEIVVHLAARPDRLTLLPALVPPRHDLWLQVAGQLEDQGRFAAATSAREQALAVAADARQRLEVRLSWSRALLDRGDAAQALVQARQALAVAPNDVDALRAMADAHERRGEWRDAEARLIDAIGSAESVDRDGDRATRLRARLARFLAKRGDHVRALREWRAVIQATPNDAWAHYEIGGLLETLGDGTGAFLEYRRAEQLGRQDASLNAAVARTYAHHGLLREASVAYRRAIALQPAETAHLEAELRRMTVGMEGREEAGDGEH